LPFLLTKPEREELKKFLSASPEIHPITRSKFLVEGNVYDYSEYIKLPRPFNWYEKIIYWIIGNIANLTIVELVFEMIINNQHKKFIRDLISTGKI
jgi:hypothetical protein